MTIEEAKRLKPGDIVELKDDQLVYLSRRRYRVVKVRRSYYAKTWGVEVENNRGYNPFWFLLRFKSPAALYENTIKNHYNI